MSYQDFAGTSSFVCLFVCLFFVYLCNYNCLCFLPLNLPFFPSLFVCMHIKTVVSLLKNTLHGWFVKHAWIWPCRGHHNQSQFHQEFAIFDREQAYPCYVVQYKVSWWWLRLVVWPKNSPCDHLGSNPFPSRALHFRCSLRKRQPAELQSCRSTDGGDTPSRLRSTPAHVRAQVSLLRRSRNFRPLTTLFFDRTFYLSAGTFDLWPFDL